jgi:L-serine kinase (ADP)
MSAPIELIEVARLRPIEGHGPKRALWLEDKILSEGTWSVPLKIEGTRGLIMDGHHRFEVAKALGLKRVPAQIYSYEHIHVFSLRPNITVTPEVIYDNYEKGIIFPYKTAKHVFPQDANNFQGVDLNDLR